MDWFIDDSIDKDKIFMIPTNLRRHTISCCEEYYDKEKETTVYKVTSKQYLFLVKDINHDD